jgi:PAS domain-containing protein
MADGDATPGAPIERSEQPGHIGMVLLLGALLLAGIVAVRFVEPPFAQPLVLALLAFFAMAGVFFLFAAAMGMLRFGERTAASAQGPARLILDSAPEALLAADRHGRVVYANRAYAALAGTPAGDVVPSSGSSPARPRSRKPPIASHRPPGSVAPEARRSGSRRPRAAAASLPGTGCGFGPRAI